YTDPDPDYIGDSYYYETGNKCLVAKKIMEDNFSIPQDWDKNNIKINKMMSIDQENIVFEVEIIEGSLSVGNTLVLNMENYSFHKKVNRIEYNGKNKNKALRGKNIKVSLENNFGDSEKLYKIINNGILKVEKEGDYYWSCPLDLKERGVESITNINMLN